MYIQKHCGLWSTKLSNPQLECEESQCATYVSISTEKTRISYIRSTSPTYRGIGGPAYSLTSSPSFPLALTFPAAHAHFGYAR